MVRIKERYLLVNIVYPPKQTEAVTTRTVAPTTHLPTYLLLHKPTTHPFSSKDLLNAIRKEVQALFGNYGAGVMEVGIAVKYLSLATSTFILKVSRHYYRLVWAALTTMSHLPVSDPSTTSMPTCTYRVVHVSGTIRKLEVEAVRRARHLVLCAKDELARGDGGKKTKGGRNGFLESVFTETSHDEVRKQDDDAIMDFSD